MRLVDDHQVEMAHSEAPLAVARLVDQSHHGWVGRDVDASLGVLLGDQVDGRGVGQVTLEGIDRLIHQRHPVGEEEHALGPVAAHEQVGERDHRACLASTRRHHEQRLAVVVALEGFGDAADGPGLVVAVDDLRTDRGLRQRAPRLPPLDQQLQLRLLVETQHPARRVAGVVPGPVLVAVRVKDDRPLPELALQAIGVELGLLLPDAGVVPRALGLDEPERLAVVAPEDVVHETLALGIGHPADLELAVAGLIERPAGFLQQQVDEVVASLRFGVVVGVRLRGGCLLGLGHLGPQALEFLIERALVREQRRELLVALPEAFRKRAQLLRSLLPGRRGAGAAPPDRRPARAPGARRGRRSERTSRPRGRARAAPPARQPPARRGGCAPRGCRAC